MRSYAAALIPMLALTLIACGRDRADNATGNMAVSVTEAPAAKVGPSEPFPAMNSAEAPAAGDQGLDAVVDSALANAATNTAPAAGDATSPAEAPAGEHPRWGGERPAHTEREPTPPPGGRSYSFVGTEPFWGGTLAGDTFVLDRADHDDLRVTVTGPRTLGGWQVWSGRWQQSTITVRVRRVACNDGMSDNEYAYEAEVVLWGTTLQGCASRR